MSMVVSSRQRESLGNGGGEQAKLHRHRPAVAAALASLTIGVASCLATAASATAEPLKCQRAILKESGKFAQTKLKTLAKCEEAKLNRKLDAETICASEAKTAAKIAAAEAKLRAAVSQQCGGRDKRCGEGGDDDTPAAIGWPNQCPDFEGTGCVNPIDDCDGIAQCVFCIDDAAVNQAVALSYDDLRSSTPRSDLSKCQLAIGKAAAQFFAASSKALARCFDARLNGKHDNACPTPGDGKAEAAIAQAEEKKRAAICKACGGDDKTCGTADDWTPTEIGFPAHCPSVNGCGQPVATLTDLVDCVDCVTSFKVGCIVPLAVPPLASYPLECVDVPPTPAATATPAAPTATHSATSTASATRTASPTPTTTPSGPVCGNGMVESGEDCDDGNTADCDACPATCRVPSSSCTVNAVRHPQSVRVQAPADTNLAGALVCLRYPDGIVSLPGNGQVSGRLSGFNGFTAVNDFDNAVQVSLLPNTAAPQLTFTLSFDLCVGATAPPPAAFSCVTKDASDEFGARIDPPTQVVCTPQ